MGETDVTDVNPLVLTKTPESPDSTKLMAYEQLFLAPGWPRGQRLNRLSEPIQVKCALDTGCVLIDAFLIAGLLRRRNHPPWLCYARSASSTYCTSTTAVARHEWSRSQALPGRPLRRLATTSDEKG